MTNLCFLFFGGLLAFSVIAKDMMPKEIYQRAREAMDTMSFSAVRYAEGDHTKIQKHTVQYRFSDGAVCKRVEIFGDYGSVVLTNRQGDFEFFPEQKLAFKRNASNDDQFFDLLSSATFTVKDVIFHEQPCYYLTAKTHPSRVQLDKISQMSRELVPGGVPPKRLSQNLQRTEVFYIGKENFFIYRHDVFSNAGKLITSYQWDTVDFAPVVEEKFFELPNGCAVEVTDGLIDFAKREGAFRLERVNQIRAQRNQSFDRQKQRSFLQGISWVNIAEILAWAGVIVCAVALLVLKLWPVVQKKHKEEIMMSKKVLILGLFVLLLGSWLRVAKLTAEDNVGGKQLCYNVCEVEWLEGRLYCLALIENLSECWANNDNALEACKQSCDYSFPDYSE